MRRWVLQLVALIVAACLLLLGLTVVGDATRTHIQDLDRYLLAFTEIECDPPPNQTRTDFLSEVQYLAGMPAQVRLLDDQLASRLAAAFAEHPWVERVEQVQVLPTHEIRARLLFRKPALAVKLSASSNPASLRVVDDQGVLLPTNAPADGLPTLSVDAKEAPGCAGKPWDTPAIDEASRIAGLCLPHKLLRFSTFLRTRDGWVLHTPGNSSVNWGRSPGAERSDEAPAAQKVQRLLAYCSQYGGLDVAGGTYELDVRLKKQAIRRPLPTIK
jgi:hypothetical protein